MLAQAERLRDRRHDELPVADRRERDEEDAVSELLDHLGGGLEREARLAGAAGARERQQADVVGQERLQLLELVVAPDQRIGWTGRFVGRLSSVFSGGNSAGSPRVELVELLRAEGP